MQGNNYWTLRESHGRPKAFQDPKELWDEACEYFTWVQSNPIIKTERKSGDKSEVKEIEYLRPMTEEGLCAYLGISQRTWFEYKNGKESYKDFLLISEAIQNIIKANKFEGAITGIYNSNIIARDLGLSDKREVEKTKVIVATNKRPKDQ